MRALLLLTTILATPALADRLEVTAPVTGVVLYLDGATVTRTASFAAPGPGVHEIVVAGLPRDVDPATLRVQAPGGVTVGAVSLAEARAPATEIAESDAMRAARAEVERLEAAVQAARRAQADLRAGAEVAAAKVDVLTGLATARADGAPLPGVEALQAIGTLIAAEMAAARKAALDAEDAIAAADRALQPVLKDLARAQAAVAALSAPPEDGPVLVLQVQAAAAGEVALAIETVTGSAGWSPVYDLRLTRDPDALAIARGVMVRQDTGEDWQGVALTLSTARPSAQAAPSAVWPDLRMIYPGAPPQPLEMSDAMAAGAPAPVMVAEAAPDAARFGFDAGMQGTVFTFRFQAPVDVRSGADALRLAMDDLAAEVDLRADAVPLLDATAFLVAEMTNATGQPLLPGPAMLYAEGALVGGTDLPLVADGDTLDLGFGAIDGLVLSREVPSRSEGEQGILSTSNRRTERAVLKVQNLTGQPWEVRVTDRVPYSEQDDLAITWEASPAPATDSADGRRGVLTWDLAVAPGQTAEIVLETELAWPEGMVLP